MIDCSFPKSARLRNPEEFGSVYRAGSRTSSRSFVVFRLANGRTENRFGVTTSRKLGPAHERNRIRRRVREIVRLVRTALVPGFDIVVNPRRSVFDRDFQELEAELVQLLGGTP